jgi:divalent metal cation (Fe/Co/Zn/Cd) transporter
MESRVQIGVRPGEHVITSPPKPPRTRVFWLQGVTLAWMLVEFGVSAYGAAAAHSPALLAFSSDSLVELMSAGVVLLQWVPKVTISERTAARTASVLLFVLAPIVVGVSVTSLVLGARPESSRAGITITIAALFAMPVLAWMKRHEARRSGNAGLAADATQSATCAYLALITLVGLSINAVFLIARFDAAAALAAVPILLKEGRAAWKGQTCGCCAPACNRTI